MVGEIARGKGQGGRGEEQGEGGRGEEQGARGKERITGDRPDILKCQGP